MAMVSVIPNVGMVGVQIIPSHTLHVCKMDLQHCQGQWRISILAICKRRLRYMSLALLSKIAEQMELDVWKGK
uniref:Ovule protein n=1 Tax=Ascaris lumbricoides TaxID=6252 RepID=A0A0M3HUQ1_ASCLU